MEWILAAIGFLLLQILLKMPSDKDRADLRVRLGVIEDHLSRLHGALDEVRAHTDSISRDIEAAARDRLPDRDPSDPP